MGKRFITNGKVPCSERGRDIDVDVCLRCRFLKDVRKKERPPFVNCAGASSASIPYKSRSPGELVR